MQFGPFGLPELLVILAIALVVFGPKRLPELSRSLGRAIAEFRRGATDLRRNLEDEVHELDREVRARPAQPADHDAGAQPATGAIPEGTRPAGGESGQGGPGVGDPS